jgi:Tfp pilus assembly major pilin PilA
MIVMIIAILLALALPAYQDYSIRAKTGEGLSIAASPKLAVSETCQTDPNADITDPAVSGYSFVAGGDDTDYVASVDISDDCTAPVITVGINTNTGAPAAFNLILTGDPTASGQFQWACSSDGLPQHVPTSCRGT